MLLRQGNGELSERLRGVIVVLVLLSCFFVGLDDMDLPLDVLVVATARSTCNTLDPLALDDVVLAFTAAALASLPVCNELADSDVLERIEDMSLFFDDRPAVGSSLPPSGDSETREHRLLPRLLLLLSAASDVLLLSFLLTFSLAWTRFLSVLLPPPPLPLPFDISMLVTSGCLDRVRDPMD